MEGYSQELPKKKKYIQKPKYVEKKVQQAGNTTKLESYQKKTIFKQINEEEKGQKQKVTKTTVINVKVKFLRQLGYNSLENWLQNPNHIYIGRNMTHYVPGAVQSKWANPFKVDKFGREGCIKQYRQYVLSRKDLLTDIRSLKGKVLGCWCYPQGCHGDVLAQLADKLQ